MDIDKRGFVYLKFLTEMARNRSRDRVRKVGEISRDQNKDNHAPQVSYNSGFLFGHNAVLLEGFISCDVKMDPGEKCDSCTKTRSYRFKKGNKRVQHEEGECHLHSTKDSKTVFGRERESKKIISVRSEVKGVKLKRKKEVFV